MLAAKETYRVLQVQWNACCCLLPLGAFGTFYGTNRVMKSVILKEIAQERGNTVAQVVPVHN